jgi:hypothetical protein
MSDNLQAAPTEPTPVIETDVTVLNRVNAELARRVQEFEAALRKVPHEPYCESMKRANVPDEMCTCKPGSPRGEAQAALANQPATVPVKVPEGIALPCTVLPELPSGFSVRDGNNRVITFTDTREQADWICAALNAAGASP